MQRVARLPVLVTASVQLVPFVGTVSYRENNITAMCV